MRENVHALMEGLLCSLFGSSSGVAHFIARLDEGSELTRCLPNAENAPLGRYCHELIQELIRRDSLKAFFEPLMEAFPGRLRDLRVMQQQICHVPVGSWLANDMGSEYAREQLTWLQPIVSMANHAALELCVSAPPSAYVRDVFVECWPTRDVLAEWTALKVIRLGFLAECAVLLGCHLQTVELGLRDRRDELLKDIFPEKFVMLVPSKQPKSLAAKPAGLASPSAARPNIHERDLGAITVKEVLVNGLVGSVAFVVGQPVSRVEARLRDAHGKQHVRNLFWDQWPGEETFGDYTIAQVLQHRLLGTITAITGLPFADVQRHVVKLREHAEVDRILVRNVLHACWPTTSREMRADDGVREFDLEVVTVGELARVGVARGDLIDMVAQITGIKRDSEIEKRLLSASAETRLRDVFPNKWPTWDGWMRLTATTVLKHGLVTSVARRLELDPRYVFTKLQAVHGNSQIGTIFEYVQPESAGVQRLGELTLADVDRRELRDVLTDVLVQRGLLQKKGVTQRFNSNHGHSLVRNVFRAVPRDEWPLV